MNKRALTAALLTIISLSGASAQAPATADDIAKRPASAADSDAAARYAWFLFVQAVKPANGALTFETWTEQCKLNPNMVGCPPPQAQLGKKRVFHVSPLARSLRGLKGLAADATDKGIECTPMQTTTLNGYPPPSNVTAKAQFCEEVYVNPPEANFVKTNGLITLTGQQAYAKGQGGAITFPWDAVEIKADWVPTSSFNPSFQCPDPTHSLYTETINGTCYALVGLHISSKVLPDWLWATFEPASTITNPNRCDANLYDTCFDPWGTTSKTPYGKGTTVPQSPQLKQLMASAGLDPAFNNYFLTGAQTQFVSAQNTPIPLGNSFVEFNAGVNPGTASCITCHKYAYYDGNLPQPGHVEDNFGGPANGWSAVGYACSSNPHGNCTPVTPGSISQDFSWMLGLMPGK